MDFSIFPLNFALIYDRQTPSITLVWNSTPPAGGQTYTVQRRSSLVEGDWVSAVTGIPSGGNTTTDTVHAGGDTQFYRISNP